jgi:hypothetical protein
MNPKSPITALKSFVANLLLWSLFIAGLAASMGSGAVLEGREKTVATLAGIAVSLVIGPLIMKKPKIKALMATRPALWFVFLCNGSLAVLAYFTMHSAKGIATAAAMGLVSAAGAGGLVASYRRP